MEIRDAVESDFDEITAIYNEVLINSTAIYNDTPVTHANRLEWWRQRLALGYPMLVCVKDDRIAGFATFGDFRPSSGYRFTVEVTIHMHSSARGQGMGTQLLNGIADRARGLGKHSMLAGVDSENLGSLRFLERFGFRRVAYFPEVGYKFGRFLNLHFLQYWLTPPIGETSDDSGAPAPHMPSPHRS
jgi:phosphinothricin acetyltransferase